MLIVDSRLVLLFPFSVLSVFSLLFPLLLLPLFPMSPCLFLQPVRCQSDGQTRS